MSVTLCINWEETACKFSQNPYLISWFLAQLVSPLSMHNIHFITKREYDERIITLVFLSVDGLFVHTNKKKCKGHRTHEFDTYNFSYLSLKVVRGMLRISITSKILLYEALRVWRQREWATMMLLIIESTTEARPDNWLLGI